MNLIDQLLAEKQTLIERIKAIDVLLETYGGSKSNTTEFGSRIGKLNMALINASSRLQYIGNFLNFPLEAKRDRQVLWIFEKCFVSAVKMNQIQDAYNELNGLDENKKEIRIDNVARTLKSKGELVVVKYNNANKLSFWGLSSWIGENDFLNEFKPAKNLLPDQIDSIEIVNE